MTKHKQALVGEPEDRVARNVGIDRAGHDQLSHNAVADPLRTAPYEQHGDSIKFGKQRRSRRCDLAEVGGVVVRGSTGERLCRQHHREHGRGVDRAIPGQDSYLNIRAPRLSAAGMGQHQIEPIRVRCVNRRNRQFTGQPLGIIANTTAADRRTQPASRGSYQNRCDAACCHRFAGRIQDRQPQLGALPHRDRRWVPLAAPVWRKVETHLCHRHGRGGPRRLSMYRRKRERAQDREHDQSDQSSHR